jgi:hypothetical protein
MTEGHVDAHHRMHPSFSLFLLPLSPAARLPPLSSSSLSPTPTSSSSSLSLSHACLPSLPHLALLPLPLSLNAPSRSSRSLCSPSLHLSSPLSLSLSLLLLSLYPQQLRLGPASVCTVATALRHGDLHCSGLRLGCGCFSDFGLWWNRGGDQ